MFTTWKSSFGNNIGGRKTPTIPGYESLLDGSGEDLMFHIMNGDYIYEHYRTREARPHPLELYRDDYKYYMDTAVHMSEFMRYVPSFWIFDDHELSDEKGMGEVGLGQGRYLGRDIGMKAWYEYAGWGNFTGPDHGETLYGKASAEAGNDLLHDSNADFSDLDPESVTTIHLHEDAENAGVYGLKEVVDSNTLRVTPEFRTTEEEASYSVGTHHYYDFKVSNCHYFCIDTRSENTEYLPDEVNNPDRHILGKQQAEWLKRGVARTDADFVFIVSSVSWMIYHTNFHMFGEGETIPTSPKTGRALKEDGFTGAMVEREELLNFFDEINKPIIILTGDLHNALAVQVTDNIWEFMIGPINSGNQPRATAGHPPYGGWFDSEGRGVKIKWIAGFPDELSYMNMRSNFYGVIQVNNLLKSSGPEPGQLYWVAYDAPQVVVRFHDAYSGKLVYAEGISTVDAKPQAGAKSPGFFGEDNRAEGEE